jgi:hypothetical protein
MATLRSKARSSAAAASFALPNLLARPVDGEIVLGSIVGKVGVYVAACGDDFLAKGTQSKAPMVKTAIMIQASLIA